MTVVSADVPGTFAEPLLEALEERGFSAATWEDVERVSCRVDIFLVDPSDAANAHDALAAAGRTLGLDLRPATSVLPPQDWAESWKRFFRIERIGSRLVVRPPWEPYQAKPGECVIELDPGMSFGTGRHETTQSCLALLDRLAYEDSTRSALDMGCGSGILAIAAHKLGFAPVAGFDMDPDAVANARENAERNHVENIQWQTCDLAANTVKADVVMANILAPVLIQYAACIASSVNPGPRGALIVSGILKPQYDAVRQAFQACGFSEIAVQDQGEWRSGLLARPG